MRRVFLTGTAGKRMQPAATLLDMSVGTGFVLPAGPVAAGVGTGRCIAPTSSLWLLILPPLPPPLVQVMEEGEALSKKQLAQEQTIRKLRAQGKELGGKVGGREAVCGCEWMDACWRGEDACVWQVCKLAVWVPSASCGPPSACMYPSCSRTPNLQVKELEAALEAERSKAASAVSERASTAGELAAIREQHAAELAAERQHYDRLLEVRWLTASVQWVVVGWQHGNWLLDVC